MSGCGTAAAVIGAGVSVAGATGLLGGGGNQGTSTTGSNTPNVPSWMLPYLQQNASTASSLASQPYQPYTGTQVQPLSAMQNQAGTMSQNLADNGAAVSGMNAANAVQTNVASQGVNGLSQQTMANYMNPYTSSVINATNLKAQQQEQLQQNQLQAQEGATGAFGGSRASLAQGQLQSNFAQNMMANNATMNQNNFTNAENMGMQGLGQANTAAQGMMQSTAGAQTAQLQNIGALQTAGGLQQTTGQNQLNAQYQDYLTAQAYPYQQLANSQNILNPIASLTTGTNATGFTEQTGEPGVAQALLGGATTGASIGNGITNSSNMYSFLNGSSSTPSGSYLNAGELDQTGLSPQVANEATSLNEAPIGTESMTPAEISAFSNIGNGLATGGMVPSSVAGYADGGKVQQPSLSDHINHFIDGFSKQYLQGGIVGYRDGGQVDTDLPGIPTQYNYKADTMPYTNQKPKYLIPAYAKGGKIPLQTGLPMAGVAGIKRERQHWGKPYVPQTKNDPGYLRPDIKNALSTGGIAGVPRYSNGGLTAHYDDGGAIAPSLALINADADGGQQGIDNLLSGPSQAASSTPTLSAMSSMVADQYPAQTQAESGGDTNALSSAGAAGLKQIMPATAKDPGFGVKPLQNWDGVDPRTAPIAEQIRFGNDYRNAMNAKFGSSQEGLAAYNAGPGRMEQVNAGTASMPAETSAYVNKVAPQERGGFSLITPAEAAETHAGGPASLQPVTEENLSGPQGANDKPGTPGYLAKTWSWMGDQINNLSDATSKDIPSKTAPPASSMMTRGITGLENAGNSTVNAANAVVRAPYAGYQALTGASFGSVDEAKQVLNDPRADVQDRAAASQYLMGQMSSTAKAQNAQNSKAKPTQTASTPASASNIPLSTDVPASAKDEDVSTQIQKAILNKMLGEANGQGVNLPLLSMGAAILGNRSNSLAGAIGAGGEAYTKTKQAQNAQDLEALQRSTMLDYYSGKNKIAGERADSTQALDASKIRQINAKMQQSPNDPSVQAATKAFSLAKTQGASDADAHKEAIAAYDNSESFKGQGVTQPASGAYQVGSVHSFNGNNYVYNGGPQNQQSSYSIQQ